MGLDTLALVTLQDAKDWIGESTSDYDTEIEIIINGVSAMFREHTHRNLIAQDRTVYLDGKGDDTIMAPDYPINSITNIYSDADHEFGSGTEITEYSFYEDGEIILDSSETDEGRKTVKLSFNAGYERSELPADIKKAALMQIKYAYRQWRDDTEGLTGVAAGDGSITMVEPGQMLEEVKQLLNTHIRYSRG